MSLKEELEAICQRLDAIEDYLGFGESDDDEDDDDGGGGYEGRIADAESRATRATADAEGRVAAMKKVVDDLRRDAMAAVDEIYKVHTRLSQYRWASEYNEELSMLLIAASNLLGCATRR